MMVTVPALIVPDNRILSGRIVADNVEVIVCICTDGSYSITAETDKQPWESLGNSIRNDYVDDSPVVLATYNRSLESMAMIGAAVPVVPTTGATIPSGETL